MKILFISFLAELNKLRRAKILWVTLLLFLLIPFMMSLLVWVARHPETAGASGVTADKATITSWPEYFKILLQGIAGIGLVGAGFVTSWLFGREFSDHTFKDIIALPVSRAHIITSKFILAMLWTSLLGVVFLFAGLLFGHIMGLGPLAPALFNKTCSTFFSSFALSLLLVTPVAFLAGYGKGVLLPLGFVILTVIFANLMGMINLAQYFPWAIPGIFAVAPDKLNGISYCILLLTFVSGLAGTFLYWYRADHK